MRSRMALLRSGLAEGVDGLAGAGVALAPRQGLHQLRILRGEAADLVVEIMVVLVEGPQLDLRVPQVLLLAPEIPQPPGRQPEDARAHQRRDRKRGPEGP